MACRWGSCGGIGVSSDRTGWRVFHFCLSALVAAAGFAIAALNASDVLVILGFCLASGGVYSGLSTFWTIPPLFLGGTAAAGAFALINCVGNLVGLCRPGADGLAAADHRQLSRRPSDVCRGAAGGGGQHGASEHEPEAHMIADTALARSDVLLARAAWRLIPFMMAMYVVSFLDRVNIGFAALTMNKDLGFSPEIYGIAAGIFFFGYFLFEVPSNLALEKVGARIWMCRICVTWGALSMLTAFARTPFAFCVLRFCWARRRRGFIPAWCST